MAKSTITGSSKKKRGRPALYEGSEGKGAPQIGLRLPPSELAAIDALERHVIDPSDDQSLTAILDKVSGAVLIETRQKQEEPCFTVATARFSR